ncbi:MAG: rRNA (uridine2552-2-O)-methyltransferase [Desulfovibrionales bacterium]|nr:rRNA (uridine2552-2-O)-methyltransferase [Desulfovibrionales bacterium]
MKKYRDHYFKKAKEENYPARSVYKLQELNQRFHILSPGQRVLDLGAAPGSWTLFTAKKIGPEGLVLAVDLQSAGASFPENVVYLQADVLEEGGELQQALEEHGPFDLVLSDMAPKTTGVKFTDQARSLELCEMARDIAVSRLTLGGALVVKIFEGPDVKAFMDGLRDHFFKVRAFKPKSSRSESKETFLLAQGLKDQTT